MKKKILIYGIIIVGLLVVIYFLFFNDDTPVQQFTFGEVTRGDLSTTITSTGTIEALSTVDVGTQVSGRIDKIFVDFNDHVKKGKLLAILDTTALWLQVKDAEAGLQKAQAQYEQTNAQFQLDSSLYAKGLSSDIDYITSKTANETALSGFKSAKTTLERSKTNLDYAFIYSPINGIIINRNVEQGQTVAASLSAPTLFVIAEDLSKMRILASVDESDIGQIKVGQDAEFTVQAYPETEFKGKVVQIRLNPTVESNVVNYTVVEDADNRDNLLLPGMTATIDFYIEKRNNVLMVPNTALRFQPTEVMIEDFRKEQDKQMANLPDSIKNKFQNRSVFQSGQNMRNYNNDTSKRGTVWYINNKGEYEMSYLQLGLTDGKNTEVVHSRNLKEGMKVITGSTESSTDNNTNRFMMRRFGRAL
jgi:HlyD family secretion protein